MNDVAIKLAEYLARRDKSKYLRRVQRVFWEQDMLTVSTQAVSDLYHMGKTPPCFPVPATVSPAEYQGDKRNGFWGIGIYSISEYVEDCECLRYWYADTYL